jgi:hypothetical protein
MGMVSSPDISANVKVNAAKIANDYGSSSMVITLSLTNYG